MSFRALALMYFIATQDKKIIDITSILKELISMKKKIDDVFPDFYLNFNRIFFFALGFFKNLKYYDKKNKKKNHRGKKRRIS